MLSKLQFMSLSNFRYQLACFLHFSEGASSDAGITPKQYLLLLHIRGAEGRSWASVGEAGRATAIESARNRCARQSLRGAPSGKQTIQQKDARCVEVHLTAQGKTLVTRIATRHRAELRSMKSSFRVANVS